VFPNQIPIEGYTSVVVQAVESRNRCFTQTSVPKILFYATPGCTIRETQISWCRGSLHLNGCVVSKPAPQLAWRAFLQ
jgi:haloalkane dehalogenase